MWRWRVLIMWGVVCHLALVAPLDGQEKLTAAEAGELYKQANALRQAGEFDKALRVLEPAVQASPRVWDERSTQQATVLNLLAQLNTDVGEYAKAESLFRQSLNIREEKLGPDDLSVARSLNNLATLYVVLGQYAKAEPLFLRSRAIKEAKLGADHPEVAALLNNLANLYRTMGQHSKGETLAQRSVKLLEAKHGPEHPLVANSLTNLALLYEEMGDFAKAEPLHQRSLKIREVTVGPDHPDFAGSLNNLAGLYLAVGQPAKAAPLYEQSLKIREAKLGPDHVEVASSLHNLALARRNLQQYAKAELLFDRSLKIRQAALGHDDPDVADTLHLLAHLYEITGRTAEAAAAYDQARRTMRRHMLRIVPFLPDAEQIAFLATADWGMDWALSLAWERRSDPVLAAKSAAWLFNHKGLGHQALAERALLARATSNLAESALVQKLTSVRTQLAALTHGALAPAEGSDGQARRMAELSAQERELAGKLARVLPSSPQDDTWVESTAVAKAIPADSALVEIHKFYVVDFKTRKYQSFHYAAWVILPDEGRKVQLIDLGDAETIDKGVEAVRRATQGAPEAIQAAGEAESERALRTPLETLAKLVLHPLLPHIAEKKNWIISPDASLWLVPWTALPLVDGRYAVEGHGIRYVICGRDLTASEGPKLEPSAPVIMADPNFDLGLADAAAETRRVLRRESTASGLRAPAESLGKVQWARLPGTAVEAEAVGPNLEKYAGKKPYVYTENFALEGVLKAFVRPRVAVLSTHGFFLPDQDTAGNRVRQSSAEPRLAPNRQSEAIENPLLRCGLVLAGANHKSTDSNIEDGVLTGLEIVSLDLRGTELVVLSACETGLGDVRNGEGVAGLRQAFQLAGAQSVVATLWQIPDRDSALLMSDFFQHLAKGRGKSESLREAQLARIKARRERNGAAHPFYWAAYTLTGKDR